MRPWFSVALVLATAACEAPPRADVLIYTRTLGYRHADAIAAGAVELPRRLAEAGLSAEVTEDPAAFTPAGLADRRAVVFLYTSGNHVLDAGGKAALEAFVARGGGWVGLHSAADTEYAWPFYQQLVVAPFESHPAIQTATVDVVDRDHPATVGLPAGRWTAEDEWYNFARDPAAVPGVRVLATLDETTYTGGTMGTSHPIIWAHETLGGRVLYSGLGHVATRWQEPEFADHVVRAIAWSARGTGP